LEFLNAKKGVVFEQQPLDFEVMKHDIKWRVTLWSKAWKENISYAPKMLARNFSVLPFIFA